MRDGQAGLGHPPWEGGGGQAEACLQRGVEGVFEAGCLGEFVFLSSNPDTRAYLVLEVRKSEAFHGQSSTIRVHHWSS